MKNKIYYENFKDAIERNRKKIPAVHKKLKAAGVQYVMSSWIDLHGIPKTKPVPMSDFEQLCLGKGPQFAVHSISFVILIGFLAILDIKIPHIKLRRQHYFF